jgi:hypothetical protein
MNISPAINLRACPKIIALLFLMAFAFVQAAPAQQPAAGLNDEREAYKRLLKRIEELEARIKELEASRTKAALPDAPGATAKADKEKVESEDAGPRGAHDATDHGVEINGGPNLRIRGFADVGFRASDDTREANSFSLGQLDLFVTSRLSDTFSVLGELVLEANDENEFGFELERLLLQYSPSDYLNVAVGRYHTSIGYYNTAFHHGTWFQTATGRPFIFEFEDEGGILPIHNVGVAVNGHIPSGKLGLRYVAEVGNGRASRHPFDEAVQTVTDENNRKAVNFGLRARPDWSPGFEAGFSVYHDRLAPEGSSRIDETIMAAHVVYQNSTLELLNEGLLVRHSPRGSAQTFNTPGFYTQVSRQFGKARPYFRYQYVNAPGDEPIFGDVGRMSGPSFGLRYDVSEFAAFKAQYDRTARRRLNAVNGLNLQLAFTF